MNDLENELRDKWNRIGYHYGGSLKLALKHPLDWYVCYVTSQKKSIVIVSESPVSKINSSKSILAECNIRKDGRYAISFTLVSIEQEDVFIAMCGDLIRFSGKENDASRALEKVMQRYMAWLKLLDHKNDTLMGINAQKGLIGELLYLKDVIEQGMAIGVALDGWVGPEGADQDFVYVNGWHEIKTTGISSLEVTISSVEQLDSNENGELVVMRVDKCAPSKNGSFTLHGLVHELIQIMNATPEEVERFTLKLASAGYIDLPEYEQLSFVFYSRKTYRVDESFPRLRRSNLPIELTKISYQLNLPSLKFWEQ